MPCKLLLPGIGNAIGNSTTLPKLQIVYLNIHLFTGQHSEFTIAALHDGTGVEIFLRNENGTYFLERSVSVNRYQVCFRYKFQKVYIFNVTFFQSLYDECF